MTGRVRIGTSSWSAKEWVGPFYSEGTEPKDFLTEYAKRFDSVETDSTYYRVPSKTMVKTWADKTPDDFRMSAKFPRSVCHAGEGPRPDPDRIMDLDRTAKDRHDFFTAMLELGDKCGPLVLQFPYFNKTAFPNPKPFLDRLDTFLAAQPGDFRYAVEIRNKWWIKADFLEILRRHSAAMVLVDQAWMPHADELPKRLDPVTTDFAYVRLLGDRKEIEAITKTWEREVIDRTEKLVRWAKVIRELRERLPETFAFANNHYAGHGPSTVRKLSELLESGNTEA
ncbi:MAG: DUF72 domain-containing protein [Planctomycetota bacterium]